MYESKEKSHERAFVRFFMYLLFIKESQDQVYNNKYNKLNVRIQKNSPPFKDTL